MGQSRRRRAHLARVQDLDVGLHAITHNLLHTTNLILPRLVLVPAQRAGLGVKGWPEKCNVATLARE